MAGCMSGSEAAQSRQRRLRDAIQAVRDAVASDLLDHSVPDAVAGALDALYDFAEIVNRQGRYTSRSLENYVAGDVGGETTLALVCARGAKAHALVDFGDLYTYGSHGYGEGPYGGGWAWQGFENEDLRFARRSDWYDNHVRGHRVLGPLEVGYAWLTCTLGLSAD